MRVLLLMALSLAAAPLAAAPKSSYGLLLLAHGGDSSWNGEIMALRDRIRRTMPVEVALGMADADAIQKALDRLELGGLVKIVAVPLFIHSDSEVMDQTRFVLGIAERPSAVFHRAMAAHPHGSRSSGGSHRVKSLKPLTMTKALDDHPLVAEILLERAKAISQAPASETVIVVGHGPVDDAANAAWFKTMQGLAGWVKAKGGFKSAAGATLRDDAPASVRAKAVKELRELVTRASLNGRVLVVPHLIARGGIEKKVAEALAGLRYSWDGETLMPHKNMERWVLESAAVGAKKEDMRRFR